MSNENPFVFPLSIYYWGVISIMGKFHGFEHSVSTSICCPNDLKLIGVVFVQECNRHTYRAVSVPSVPLW